MAFEEQVRLCAGQGEETLAAEGLGGLAAVAAIGAIPTAPPGCSGAAEAIGSVGDADVIERLERDFLGGARAPHRRGGGPRRTQRARRWD